MSFATDLADAYVNNSDLVTRKLALDARNGGYKIKDLDVFLDTFTTKSIYEITHMSANIKRKLVLSILKNIAQIGQLPVPVKKLKGVSPKQIKKEKLPKKIELLPEKICLFEIEFMALSNKSDVEVEHKKPAWIRYVPNRNNIHYPVNFEGTQTQLKAKLSEIRMSPEILHIHEYNYSIEINDPDFAPFYNGKNRGKNRNSNNYSNVPSDEFNQLDIQYREILPDLYNSDNINLMDILRGIAKLPYFDNSMKTSNHSCFIDALLNCNYSMRQIKQSFADCERADFRVSARDVIQFVESHKGKCMFYDALFNLYYESANEPRKDRKVLTGILDHEHFTEISAKDLKKRFNAVSSTQQKEKRFNFVKWIEKPGPINLPIESIKYVNNMDAKLVQLVKQCVNQNKRLPLIQHLHYHITQINSDDKIYSSLPRQDIDIILKFRNTNPSDSKSMALGNFASLIMRELNNFCCCGSLSDIRPENKIVNLYFECRGVMPDVTRELLNSYSVHAKNYLFNGKMLSQAITAIDQTKAYTHYMRHIRNIIFTPNSIPTKFEINELHKGRLPIGLYWVVTDDIYLAQGSGFYLDTLVMKMIQKKIPFMTKYYIPLTELQDNKFSEFVGLVIEKFGSEDDVKLANRLIGQLIGCSYKKKSTSIKHSYSLNIDDARNAHEKYGAIIRKLWYDGNDGVDGCKYLYEMIQVLDKRRSASITGIYLEIINQSYMQMYDLMEALGLDNIIYIKTDCIGTTLTEDQIRAKIRLVPSDSKCAADIGGFKLEKIAKSMNCYSSTNKDFVHPELPDDKIWNHISEIPGGASVCICGIAGSGKTTLVKKYSNDAIRLAPTNAAARVIGGQTMDSFFNSNFLEVTNDHAMKVANKVVWIDEISMLSYFHWHALSQLKKLSPNTQFILTGDFLQLPAVKSPVNFEKSHVLKWICDYNLIHLETSYRCNFASTYLEFIRINLDNRRDFQNTLFREMLHPRAIVFTNERRRELNEIALNKFGYKFGEYRAGVPLICKKNEPKYNIYNNNRYIIKSRSYAKETTIINEFDNVEIRVPTECLPKYFEYGYAMTTYAAQGQTFEFSYIISIPPNIDLAHKYVAVSRARDIDQILNVIH